MENKPLDNKLLLLNCITLLYRESQLPNMERSGPLVRSVMALVKTAENLQITMDRSTQMIGGLKRLALTMADDPSNHEYEEVEILQQIKLYCADDLAFFESFEKAITAELKESSIKRNVTNLRRSLSTHLRNEMFKTAIQRAHVTLTFKADTIPDMNKFVEELVAEIEPYQQDGTTNDPAIVSQVHFDNLESISEIMKEVQEESDGTGILRTGWQGLNRMLRGGFRRGEQWVIPALQHKNKSGCLMDIFRGVCQYNVPMMIDPSRKPLNVFFTFENRNNQNMQYIYTKLIANETGKFITPDELKQIPIEEIAQYIYTKMRATGYEVKMIQVDPTQWGYRDLCNKLLEFEAEGYEIHLVAVDYLYMLQTTGCTQGPAGHDVRDLFRRMRNFTSRRKITFLTPHQISTDGKQLVRDGSSDFVKQLVGKGYTAGSKQIDQEVDGEIYLHIEEHNGRFYQTYQRGKHRIVGQTPLIDQYFAHLFHPQLGILDDVNSEDTTLRRVGGGRVGSGEEVPFWMEDNLEKAESPF
jgi:hypothetical protein